MVHLIDTYTIHHVILDSGKSSVWKTESSRSLFIRKSMKKVIYHIKIKDFLFVSSRIRSTSFLPLNWKSKVNHWTNLDLVMVPMLSVSLSEGKFDLVVLTWNSDKDENFSLLQRWVSSLRSLYVISPLSNSKGFNFVFLRISRKTQMRGLWYWASFSISMSVNRK